MRVLLTGAGGQLAADLDAVFSQTGHEVVAVRREELDITDDALVARRVDVMRPDVILNPAAYNNVDEAERLPDAAYAVNALGPRTLARAAAAAGALLVHYSTDYVVDGRLPADRLPADRGGVGAREDDPPAPRSAYAVSKLAGEYFVHALAPRHLVLRVCGLFGAAGRHTRHGNFVETMLRVAGSRSAAAGRPLRVVCDQVVAPTSTRDVAAATLALVELPAPHGLYHCTAAGETSWYDYARAIFEGAGVRADLQPITAAEYGADAPRPAYSILDNSKLTALGVARPRHWREALAAYLAERGSGR